MPTFSRTLFGKCVRHDIPELFFGDTFGAKARPTQRCGGRTRGFVPLPLPQLWMRSLAQMIPRISSSASPSRCSSPLSQA